MSNSLRALPPLAARRPPTPGRRICASALLAALAVALSTPAALAQETHETLESTGDVGQYVPPLAGLAVALARHDGKGVGRLALASATTLAVVHTLKPIIDRRRPDGGGRSFPSGHTAMAFAGAGFLHRRYGWAYGLPAYAVGAFVGYTRVHTRHHHTSDVIAGGAIGIASNLIVTKRYRGVALTPVQTTSGPGLALSVSW